VELPVVPDDDFLDSRQACDRLGATPSRLNKLIQSGSVQIVSDHTGKRGYSQANIETFLASGVDLGTPGPPSSKGLLRRVSRKIRDATVDGFLDNL
jgi:hypothetical protein